jgi:ubiquitin-protein ligase E3 A
MIIVTPCLVYRSHRKQDINVIVIMADNDESSNSSLHEIEEHLTEVENGLIGRRGRGRAFFDSVHIMLGSLRQSLERHTEHHPTDNSSTSERGANLAERLQTAEFSLSNRVPLEILRSSQFLPVRTSARGLVSFRQVNPVTRISMHKAESNEEEKTDQTGSPIPQQERPEMDRSKSHLVVSRVQEDLLMDADMDLHEDGEMALLSGIEEATSKGGETSSEMDVEVEVSDHFLEEPKKSVLLPKRSLERMGSLSRGISGSISLPQEERDSFDYALYSWGPVASHSLHDDSKARTVEESHVSSTSRLGRLAGVLSVACGPKHSAFATNQGEIFTCGDNCSGAVNPTRRDLTEVERPSMLENLGSTMIRQVSCGWDHTAALTSAGAVLTWGNNEAGQLGHFKPPSADSPTSFCYPKTMFLGPGTRAASVSCGDRFTLVLTTRMSVLVCGVPSIAGYRAGKDEKVSVPRLPCAVPALVGLPLASISAGKDHAVVLTAHGSAYAWGSNVSSCCGRPYPTELSSPVPILMPTSQLQTPLGASPFPNWATWQEGSAVSLADDVAVVHATCGHDHTVLVTRSGRLLVCGSNDQGQLGLDVKEIVQNVEVVNHPDSSRHFTSAEAGEKNTLILDDAGDVWQMGSETGGCLKRVLIGKHIITIAAGGKLCVAVTADGGTNLQFSMTEDEEISAASGTVIARSLESLVEKVSEEMQDDDSPLSPDARELVSRTEELLKYPAVMNSLFVDPNDLDLLYMEISKVSIPKLQRALALAIEKSIQAGLKNLQSENARMIYPESVLCLLHYIRFFDRAEDSEIQFDTRGDCIISLCEAFLSVPYEGFKALMVWMTLYPRESFVRMLVKPLLSQLSKTLRIDVDSNGVQHMQISRRAVPVIVTVLRWLHRASERANNALPEDFYSKAVSKIPLETLYEDLRILKTATKEQSSHTFLICACPFLIPPSTKRDLLHVESQVHMMKAVTETARLKLSEGGGEGELTIEPFFVLEIEREHILEHTLEKIRKSDPLNLRKKLIVKFTGEEGVDAGGVTREFYQLLSEELFDSNCGMWTRRFGDEITWFNSECTWDQEGYELVGVLVGLALYNGVLLDVHFPLAVYRKLLGLPLGLEDLVDEELKKGLQQLLDYEGDDVEDIFCLTFEVIWMDMGEERQVELKPDGSSIAVTGSNKEEYVLLYVKWILVDSVQLQADAFKKGVMRILESSSLDLFRPEELELFAVGTPELDFSALEGNSVYEGGYTKESAVVKNLWRFIKNADSESHMEFLKFVTGASRAPIGGLGALPFKVQRAGIDSNQLPTSHTCFNTLLLPDYGDNYEKLADRLGRAILECEGFGLQ